MSPLDLENNQDYVRRPVKVAGYSLAILAFQTLGIIYADIGTSPLYVLNGIWSSSGPAPSAEDVIGGISAIIWSLALVPLLKYVVFALRFGTKEGEGGAFALFQGIFPPKATSFEDERTLTGDSKHQPSHATTPARRILNTVRWPILIWTLLGTSLTLADGMLTPAVSVTSAVAGLSLAASQLADDIQSLSIGFIIALFLVQRFGTAKIAWAFSPITFVWLGLLLSTGIYNTTHYPGIFRAFDPSRAVMLFVRTKNYDLLAGILLAVTGCEALFANLGQFNATSIRISFVGYTYPALTLAYLGQGARLISDGDAVISNVFYLTIPGGVGSPLYWITYVFAILATASRLVASQAMITATFSLVQQLINMRQIPPIRMLYTSETIQGQIYIPSINWALCIGTIVLVLIFKDLARLTNAYGFAISTVMFVTTTLIALQIPFVKKKPWVLAVAWLLFFGFIDGLFWGASLRKVPYGAWIPLLVGCVITLFMVFWSWAKGNEDEFDGTNRRSLRTFISTSDSEKVRILPVAQQQDEDEPSEVEELQKDLELFLETDEGEKIRLPRLSTYAIFHKMSSGKGVPHSFYGFLKQWPALPRVVIFLSVRVAPINHVPDEDRYFVTKVRTIPGFYGVTYLQGFRDKFLVDVKALTQLITSLESRANPSESRETIAEIQSASAHSTHIVPHYHVVSRPIQGWFGAPVWDRIRRLLIEEVYRTISYVFPETVNWLQAADEIIHVGVNAEI